MKELESLSQRIDYEKALEEAGELYEDYGDIIKSVPYARHVVTAFRWAKNKRIKYFLRSLNDAADDLSEGERRRFEKIINSNAGGEILAEFSDTVLRTSSNIAIAALALLYADTDERKYSPKFKASACLALEGISDELIGVFLEMASITDYKEGKGSEPYPVYFVDKNEEHLPRLTDIAPTIADKMMYMNELIRRGMLLPDPASGRFDGPALVYGVGERTRQYRDLLSKAKAFVDNN